MNRIRTIALVFTLAVLLAASGCSAFNNAVADAMRALGASPGTIYNFGTDGQLVYQAHCRSLDFESDTMFDRYNAKGEKIEDSSVIAISCGDNIIRTVGFTTVYVSDNAQESLFANSQQFANIRIQNNDRGVPLVNFAWRSVKNSFAGTQSVAQLCDQWNNPIMAFAGSVSGFGTDVAKSTMFQIKYKSKTGYVWISRGSYTVTDAALLG
jgi:Domain of unknown function (DUF5052)